MKKFQSFLGLIFLTGYGIAQSDSSGVYLTSLDFNKHKLTYGCDCSKEKCPLSTIPLFPNQKIAIQHRGEKRKLKKSELYGYRTCNDKVYRFLNRTQYLILNTQCILLYEKTQESGTGMNPEIENFYYFSVTAGDKILPMTIDNLKDAYPTNLKFHDLLDSFFKDNSELIVYDKYLKSYKLVHFFIESTK